MSSNNPNGYSLTPPFGPAQTCATLSQIQPALDTRAKVVEILSASANGCLAELDFDPREVKTLRIQNKEWQIENVKLYEDNARLNEALNAARNQIRSMALPNNETVMSLRNKVTAVQSEKDHLFQKMNAMEQQQPGQATYNRLYEEYHRVLQAMDLLRRENATMKSQMAVLQVHCQQCQTFKQQMANSSRQVQQRSLSVSTATAPPVAHITQPLGPLNSGSCPPPKPSAPALHASIDWRTPTSNTQFYRPRQDGSQPTPSPWTIPQATSHQQQVAPPQPPMYTQALSHNRSIPGPLPATPDTPNGVHRSAGMKHPRQSSGYMPGDGLSRSSVIDLTAESPLSTAANTPTIQNIPFDNNGGHLALQSRPGVPASVLHQQRQPAQVGLQRPGSAPTLPPSCINAPIPQIHSSTTASHAGIMKPLTPLSPGAPTPLFPQPLFQALTSAHHGLVMTEAASVSKAALVVRPSPSPVPSSVPPPPSVPSHCSDVLPPHPSLSRRPGPSTTPDKAPRTFSVSPPSRSKTLEVAAGVGDAPVANAGSMKRPLSAADVGGQEKRARMSVDEGDMRPGPPATAREVVDIIPSPTVLQSPEPVDGDHQMADAQEQQQEEPGGGMVEEGADEDVDDEEEEVRIGPDGLRLAEDCLAELFTNVGGGGRLCALCNGRFARGLIPEPQPYVNALDGDLVAHCMAEHIEIWEEIRSV